jgi:hypothetical protein
MLLKKYPGMQAAPQQVEKHDDSATIYLYFIKG